MSTTPTITIESNAFTLSTSPLPLTWQNVCVAAAHACSDRAAELRREADHGRTFRPVNAAVTHRSSVDHEVAAENQGVRAALPRTGIRQPRRASTTLS